MNMFIVVLGPRKKNLEINNFVCVVPCYYVIIVLISYWLYMYAGIQHSTSVLPKWKDGNRFRSSREKRAILITP
jgi:hypothetical protein